MAKVSLGKQVIATACLGTLAIWNKGTGDCEYRKKHHSDRFDLNYNGAVHASRNKDLVVVGATEGRVDIVVRGGDGWMRSHQLRNAADEGHVIRFRSDANLLLVGTWFLENDENGHHYNYGNISVWDMEKVELIPHSEAIPHTSCLEFRYPYLFSASTWTFTGLVVHNAVTGQLVTRVEQDGGLYTRSLCISGPLLILNTRTPNSPSSIVVYELEGLVSGRETVRCRRIGKVARDSSSAIEEPLVCAANTTSIAAISRQSIDLLDFWVTGTPQVQVRRTRRGRLGLVGKVLKAAFSLMVNLDTR